MTGAMVAFTVNDAFMKGLSDHLPFFQALFLRGVGTVAVMLALGAMLGLLDFRFARRDRGFVALRSVVEALAAYCFISGIFNMPLANAIAIIQVLPLTVTLAGAVFLGEQVGWRRWSLICLGLVGVLMIVQPGAEGFTNYSYFILAAVVCVTVRDIATRRLSTGVSSYSVAVIAAMTVAVLAGLGTLIVDRETLPGATASSLAWAGLDGTSLMLLAGSVFFIIVAYLCSVMTMRVGDIAFVAPFRYTSLLTALALGYFVFGDWPNGLTLVGAVIVVISGYLSFRREHRLAKETKASAKG